MVDRIDSRLLLIDLRSDPMFREILYSIAGTWSRFWATALIGGVIGGATTWWIGGWWCRIRLRWSGAEDPDKHLARLLLVYSSFVFAGPAFLALICQSFLYPNYIVAFENDFFFGGLVFLLIIWSLVTSYKGARVLFSVTRRRAQLWFIIVPLLFWSVVMGAGALLFTMFV